MTSDLPPAKGPQPTAYTGPRSLQDFFAWIRGQGVYRPDEGRWGAGVAAGLARRGNLDPILVRGIFVALTFAGGLGAGLYGIAWLLLPQEDGRIHLQEAVRGHVSAGFFGSAILVLTLLVDPWNDGGLSGGPLRFLAWIALIGLIWWLLRHRHDEARYGWSHWHGNSGSSPAQTGTSPAAAYGTSGTTEAGDVPVYGSPTRSASPPPAGPAVPWQTQWTPPARVPDRSWPSRRLTRLTLGLALLAAAAVLILADRTDGIGGTNGIGDTAGLVAAAAALGVVALGVVTAGVLGRRSGGLAGIGVLLAVGVLIGAGVHEAGVRTGQNIALAGEYSWKPASAQAARQQYNLGAGKASLDLTNPALTATATTSAPLTVMVRVGVGQLSVALPSEGARVVIDLGAGQVTEPNGKVQEVSDRDHRVTFAQQDRPTDLPVLIVKIQQAAGEILIKEPSNV